jgi:UPF0716 protein FxsA
MAVLVILFIVVPIAELYVIIQVGGIIGVGPTIALLLADALLGSLLLRHQGRSAWRRFNAAIDERRFPGKEVADGLMIAVGGTLLLTPGFITDIFGLILLVPPARAIIRRLGRPILTRRFAVVSGPAQWGYERARGNPPQDRSEGVPDQPYDIDGTAHEVSATNGAISSSNGASGSHGDRDEGELPPLPPP